MNSRTPTCRAGQVQRLVQVSRRRGGVGGCSLADQTGRGESSELLQCSIQGLRLAVTQAGSPLERQAGLAGPHVHGIVSRFLG